MSGDVGRKQRNGSKRKYCAGQIAASARKMEAQTLADDMGGKQAEIIKKANRRKATCEGSSRRLLPSKRSDSPGM